MILYWWTLDLSYIYRSEFSWFCLQMFLEESSDLSSKVVSFSYLSLMTFTTWSIGMGVPKHCWGLPWSCDPNIITTKVIKVLYCQNIWRLNHESVQVNSLICSKLTESLFGLRHLRLLPLQRRIGILFIRY